MFKSDEIEICCVSVAITGIDVVLRPQQSWPLESLKMCIDSVRFSSVAKN